MNPFAIGLAAAVAITLAVGQGPNLTGDAAEWPVSPATVVVGFQPHERFGPGHRGVDLAATPGQSVHAALPGVVTVAGQVGGRSVVVLKHDDSLRTTYLPVLPMVKVGERVAAGELIGVLAAGWPSWPSWPGWPGWHCPQTSCLHWGARRAAEYVDPLTLLPQAVVLLPN